MGDFEFFGGSESGEGMDPASFEKFKEKMKKNAAFVAALKKGEQKQKEKEDKLIKLLLKFLKDNAHTHLLVIVSRLLALNIPAEFIMYLISLGNPDVEREIVAITLSLPHGGEGEMSEQTLGGTELVLFAKDSTIPIKLKAAINEWVKKLWQSASANPFRVIETTLTKDGEIQPALSDAAHTMLEDFFLKEGTDNENILQNIRAFVEFLVTGILTKVKEQLENQQRMETSEKAAWDE